MADIEKEIRKEEKVIGKFFKNKTNVWMTISIVLAIVLILVLVWPSGMNKSQVSEVVTSFGVSKGAVLSVTNVTLKSGLYEVMVSYDGDEFPLYVSKDGKFLGQMSEIAPATTTASTTPAQQTPTVPKTAKPKVELFVMAYCPYGTQNEKGLLPVMNLLKDKADFQIKFVYYIMHGQKEIDENTLQYCIQKEQSSKFISYLTCFLNASDSAGCLVKSGVDKTKLNACVATADTQFSITKNFNNKASWLSGQYPLYDVNKAENDLYGIGGSPTLVINGVEVAARAPAKILAAVCSGFTTQPAECTQTLDSSDPSPSFGYNPSDGSATTATCG